MITIQSYQFEKSPISEMRLLKVQAEVCLDYYEFSDQLANEIRSALIQLDGTLIVKDWRTIVLANIAGNSVYFVEVFFRASRIS